MIRHTVALNVKHFKANFYTTERCLTAQLFVYQKVRQKAQINADPTVTVPLLQNVKGFGLPYLS